MNIVNAMKLNRQCSFLFWLVLTHSCWIRAIVALPRRNRNKPIGTTRYDRFIQKIYDGADVNKDGSISLTEAYELALKLYIKVNREAPIDPPTRAQISRIFSVSDTNHNRRISRAEFTQLAELIGQRALVRITATKVIDLIAAPLLATLLVHKLSDIEWLPQLAERIVPERLLPVVTSQQFCRTFLIVLLVSTLGKSTMKMVNRVLDSSLPKQ